MSQNQLEVDVKIKMSKLFTFDDVLVKIYGERPREQFISITVPFELRHRF